MNIVVGLVHGEHISGHYHHSIVQTLNDLIGRPDGPQVFPLQSVINVRSGPALALGRGRLVASFLDDTDADVLLMIDGDMSFAPATLYRMWDAYQQVYAQDSKCAILGGLAFTQAGPVINPEAMAPILWSQMPNGSLVQHRTYEPDTLYEVAATGGACLMIHREVLVAMKRHWFHHIPADMDWTLLAKSAAKKNAAHAGEYLREQVWDADQFGEDLSFCLRARKAGYRIHVHTSLIFDHAKDVLIGEQDYRPFLAAHQGQTPSTQEQVSNEPDRTDRDASDTGTGQSGSRVFPGPQPGPLAFAGVAT